MTADDGAAPTRPTAAPDTTPGGAGPGPAPSGTDPDDSAELSPVTGAVPDSDERARTARPARVAGPGDPAAPPVLIVDDHQLVALSLVNCLRSEGLDARFDPVRSTPGVLESAGRVRIGIVLLDLDLGRDEVGKPIDGVALVAPLRAAGWRVLVMTGGTDPSRLGAALAAGGFGWVPKSAPFPALLLTLREAIAGRSTIAPSWRQELIELHRRRECEHDRITARMDTLSPRERLAAAVGACATDAVTHLPTQE